MKTCRFNSVAVSGLFCLSLTLASCENAPGCIEPVFVIVPAELELTCDTPESFDITSEVTGFSEINQWINYDVNLTGNRGTLTFSNADFDFIGADVYTNEGMNLVARRDGGWYNGKVIWFTEHVSYVGNWCDVEIDARSMSITLLPCEDYGEEKNIVISVSYIDDSDERDFHSAIIRLIPPVKDSISF